MSLLDELDRIVDDAKHDVEGRFKRSVKAIQEHVIAHPQPVFALLRTVQPILLVKDIAVVTRYDDVTEVLRHDEAFSVEPYAAAMQRLAGDFILGTDEGALYERDVSIMRLAAPRTDIPALRDFCAEQAEAIVAAGDGRVDVADLTRRVPARLMGRWFGTPGDDEDQMIEWAMALFAEIFTNVAKDPEVSAKADRCAAQLRAYLDRTIAERKAGPSRTDDVLGRLLAMQATGASAHSDEQIRNDLFGLLVGFIPTVCTATTFAVDLLLDHEDWLRDTAEVARGGDDEAMRAFMWEAMRLAPQGPGLLRRAMTDFPLAEGTMREKTVPAGTLVFASTQSAMLDGDVVDDPDEFRPGRPAHHYIHFGLGMHQCFGKHANAMQIPVIAMALLRRAGLRRAEGADGELTKAGPFPGSMWVTYDAGA